MELKLTDKNNLILRTKIEKFDFENPPIDPVEFAKQLAESMLENNGIGLAANQLGLPYRVFAIAASPILVCYNPIIVDYSQETIYLEEGCLSFPNLFVKIKRPKKIKIRYTQPNGEVVTRVFDGLTSRIIQHEFDHLEGICHINRASPIHLDQAKRKAKKLSRKK